MQEKCMSELSLSLQLFWIEKNNNTIILYNFLQTRAQFPQFHYMYESRTPRKLKLFRKLQVKCHPYAEKFYIDRKRGLSNQYTMNLRKQILGNFRCKAYMLTTSIDQFTNNIFLLIISANRYVPTDFILEDTHVFHLQDNYVYHLNCQRFSSKYRFFSYCNIFFFYFYITKCGFCFSLDHVFTIHFHFHLNSPGFQFFSRILLKINIRLSLCTRNHR